MAMQAIPMKGRLTGKRISGFLWAGHGTTWTSKKNYGQTEDNKRVSAVLRCPSGSFTMRCYGASMMVTLKGRKEQVLSTHILALPGGRKK